jgi:hypothetical protein
VLGKGAMPVTHSGGDGFRHHAFSTSEIRVFTAERAEIAEIIQLIFMCFLCVLCALCGGN